MPILSVMLLFKRIMDFPRTALARLRNKRRSARCPVAPGFPLKASVNLLGTDQPAKSRATVGSGQNWGGAVADLSSEGLRLWLPPAAITARGELSVITLTLDEFELRIPCTVAHFRTQAAGAWCGLSLQFENDTQRKGYQQLLEAVVMGAGFVVAKAPKAPAGLQAERYRSEGKVILTVWRESAEGRVHCFELSMGGLAVRSDPERPALEVFSVEQENATVVTGQKKQEVLRLFRIVAANLPKTLPADLRQSMHALAKPPVVGARRA